MLPNKLFGLEKTEMILVKKGNFTMGERNETVSISLEKDFWIGKYPVTQELYTAVIGHNPSYFKGKYQPVENVSWDDICMGKDCFLNKLQAKIAEQYPDLQGTFALPFETQWEYAARGGKVWNAPNLPYAGSKHLADVGWYDFNTNEKHTMPVGLKEPNALGLHDMSGNVWEWCADHYEENLQEINKKGSTTMSKSGFWVFRGGSFFLNAVNSRSAYRNYYHSHNRSDRMGFRLVFLSV